MKIKSLAVSPTAFLHLKGPDGAHLYEDGEPVGIDLYSPGSRENTQVEDRRRSRALTRMADNDNRVTLPPVELGRAEDAEDLAALTAGFRRIDQDDAEGRPLVGSALYKAVYADPELGWIKEQALKFQANWGKFLPA